MELTDKQVEKIADISAEFGMVVMASVAIPYFFDKLNLIAGIAGFIAASIFWAFSVFLLKFIEL